MKFNFGNLLFPKLPPDLRRRRMATIYLTGLVTVVVGLAVYLVMIQLNHPGKH